MNSYSYAVTTEDTRLSRNHFPLKAHVFGIPKITFKMNIFIYMYSCIYFNLIETETLYLVSGCWLLVLSAFYRIYHCARHQWLLE